MLRVLKKIFKRSEKLENNPEFKYLIQDDLKKPLELESYMKYD